MGLIHTILIKCLCIVNGFEMHECNLNTAVCSFSFFYYVFSLSPHVSLPLSSPRCMPFSIHHSLLFLSGWSGAYECCRLKQVSRSSAAALEAYVGLKHTERPNTSFSKQLALFPSSLSTTHQTINTGVPSLLAGDRYWESGLLECVNVCLAQSLLSFLWRADVLGMDWGLCCKACMRVMLQYKQRFHTSFQL